MQGWVDHEKEIHEHIFTLARKAQCHSPNLRLFTHICYHQNVINRRKRREEEEEEKEEERKEGEGRNVNGS